MDVFFVLFSKCQAVKWTECQARCIVMQGVSHISISCHMLQSDALFMQNFCHLYVKGPILSGSMRISYFRFERIVFSGNF